jgi:hypothetical protein
MRDERLAGALLRLYPRAWRERYGDEFLAFVADTGLSWRAVADVVAAATVERMRAVVAVARYDDDPAAAVALFESRPIREVLAEGTTYILIVILTVWALGAVGVPYPTWMWWFNILFLNNGGRGFVPTPNGASWFERLTVSAFWFGTATALGGLAWVFGVFLGRWGVPAPSDAVFYTVMGTGVVCAGCRMLYCMVQTMWVGSTWRGMDRREMYMWGGTWLAIIVFLALTDPSEALRAFWPFEMILCMTLRPPFVITRAGAARRRANYEKIFGTGANGPHTPAN